MFSLWSNFFSTLFIVDVLPNGAPLGLMSEKKTTKSVFKEIISSFILRENYCCIAKVMVLSLSLVTIFFVTFVIDVLLVLFLSCLSFVSLSDEIHV